MEINRENWVITIDVLQRIYSKCPDNQESLTRIEYINSIERDILPILILIGIQQLALWSNHDMDNNIAVTTAETGYTNDWILLQLVNYFENYSAKIQ